ncbi:hypothetical protein [Pollutibacter soli]|uniref:hypothetical protein n=1 Tax=Pollutibacter soli TaxID=3034157 RepID=UPI00301355AD
MNFLLGTIIIILLLFPGFLFRSVYLNVEHGRTFKSSLVEELLFSLVPNVLIHSCLLLFILNRTDFSLDGFYLILINHRDGTDYLDIWEILFFLLYCLTSFFVAIVTGYFFRLLSVGQNWQINIPIFRIRNEWYYTLAGQYLQPPLRSTIFQRIFLRRFRRQFVRPDRILIDALVEINKEAFLYRGRLERFVLSKEDGIDRLYLTDVKRRKFSDEKPDVKSEREKLEEFGELDKLLDSPINMEDVSESDSAALMELLIDKRYYNIPGNNLILPYSEIKNLNIIYIFLDPVQRLNSSIPTI